MGDEVEYKWALVICKHGYHCDEFNIIGVRGPFTYEQANEIHAEDTDASIHMEIVPMKGE